MAIIKSIVQRPGAPGIATAEDVTTALGYTPVNKVGDTMSGPLIIDANAATAALRVRQSGAGAPFEIRDSLDAIVMRMISSNKRVMLGSASAPTGQFEVQSIGNTRTIVGRGAVGQTNPLMELYAPAGTVPAFEVLISGHVAAPLRDRGGQVYNVKTYAATATQRDALGNGVSKPLSGYYATLTAAQVDYPLASALTDELDWAVIQKAEAAANVAGGGIVHIPRGTWIVNRSVKLHSFMTLRGIGRGSLIKMRDGVNANVRVIENNNTSSGGTDTDIIVRDLAVDGNGPNQTTGGSAIAFNYVTRGLIENCFVQNAYSHSIYAAEGCVGIMVIGNWCVDCFNAGNITGAHSDDLIYANNYSRSPGRAQYKFDFCDHVALVGNVGEGDGVNVDEACGFYVTSGTHWTVVGNAFHDLARGMQWVGSDYIIAIGNDIYNMQQDGVRLLSGANVATLIGNQITNVGLAAANTYDGVRITDDGMPVTDVMILGNQIHDVQGTPTMRHGVYAASNSARIQVNHTPISGALSAKINLLGTESNHRDNLGVGDESVSRSPAESYTEDDFVSSGTTSGAVGELRWFFGGGSANADVAVAGRPGILRRDTGTTSDTYAYTMLANTASGPITPADNFDTTFDIRLPTADANTLGRVGLGSAASSNPPSNGLYLEKLAADTNWHAVSRAAGVSAARVSLAAAVAGAWVKVRLRRVSATQLGITLDSGPETLFTTNLPTVPLNPLFAVMNVGVAASRTIDIDLWRGLVTGLAR